jgi:hypothetical protein
MRYVPETSYRLERVPRVTYQPVASIDPCTGCSTTAYRPVTTMTIFPRLVPYTTYRPVYTPAYYAPAAVSCGSCAPAPSCGPCGTLGSFGSCPGGACGAPSYSGSPGCSSCASAAPSISSEPQATQATPIPKTFQEGSEPELRGTLKPIPKTDTQLNSLPAPSLIDPNSRSTARPIREASTVRLISWPQPAPAVDDGGWRSSRD